MTGAKVIVYNALHHEDYIAEVDADACYRASLRTIPWCVRPSWTRAYHFISLSMAYKNIKKKTGKVVGFMYSFPRNDAGFNYVIDDSEFQLWFCQAPSACSSV